MPLKSGSFGSAELFRYSRIEPVRVIDLALRLAKLSAPAEPEAQRAWAKVLMAEDRPATDIEALEFDYAAHLRGPEAGGADVLPGRDDLREADAFDGAAIMRSEVWKRDLARAERRFVGLALDPESDVEERAKAARLLQFVERFPRLAELRSAAPYAPILVRRNTPPLGRSVDEKERPLPGDAKDDTQTGLAKVAEHIEFVWRARAAHLDRLEEVWQQLRRDRARFLRSAHEKLARTAAESAATPAPEPHPNPGPATKAGQKIRSAAALEAKKVPSSAPSPSPLSEARRTITNEIEAARTAWTSARTLSTAAAILVDGNSLPGADSELNDAVERLKAAVRHHKLAPDSFCQLLAQVLERMDQIDRPLPPYGRVVSGRNLGATDPDFELVWDAPKVHFADTVQMLGKAELVRVDEEFASYSPAEISFIQTAMPGETRRRKTRTAQSQETVLERLEDQLDEQGQETSANSTSALKSEIETELRTRFDSSLNVSGSGSGEGSVGVVSFSGGGGVSAGLGVGIDTGLRSSNQTEFSQEILSKAVERTTRRTMERRVTRTWQSSSTSELYRLTNSTSQPVNGTYVFLNKHIAVTETVYGVRAFLEAKLLLPGRSLVSARRSRQRAIIEDTGQRPIFDIAPDQITPANYMALAGRFRASNIEPPPPPVTRLTRVFKTDSSTETRGDESFNGGKIANVLVPYFGRYKRFAITENVDLPEGYGVLSVDVAISHGANGVSVPAHLPLTLPAAAAIGMTSFIPFGTGLLGILLLPAWAWSVAYAASPVLHYNADSSNVTVTIGTEGKDSAYFFFEPDDLLQIVMDLLTAISAASPAILQGLQNLAIRHIGDMRDAAARVPEEMAERIGDAVNGAINRIRAVLDNLVAGDLTAAAAAALSIDGVDLSLANLDGLDDVFEPLTDFVGDAMNLLQESVGDAIQLALSEVLARMENNQVLDFARCRGTEGTLPVAINALALQPGVTINLSACLMRSRDGLARWQLRTFESLYQAYLQQLAAYDSRFYTGTGAGLGRSPGLMRRDERIALKERVIAALDALHPHPGTAIPIQRMELFEHAIDWDSLSYRIFDYGPSDTAMALENSAALTGADEERRRFLLASWAQVMVPLQPHDGLAAQMFDYLGDGTGSVADALNTDPAAVPETDELTALYRDLVLSRSLIGQNPPPGEARMVTLPTDLVALFEPNLGTNLPRNPNWP